MKKLTFILIASMLVSCNTSPKLDEYIGLDIKSNQMQHFLKTLGEPEINKYKAEPPVPTRTINIDGKIDTISMARKGSAAMTFYIYKEKGVQISLNDKDVVDAIFLFGEGKDGYRQYQKELPFDLKFTDTRKNIIEKFGKLEEGSFGGSSKYN